MLPKSILLTHITLHSNLNFILFYEQDGKDLSFDERNLLSVAYKNAVGGRRAAWRVLNMDENQTPASARFRAHVESELEALCKDVLELLEQYLIPHPQVRERAYLALYSFHNDISLIRSRRRA